MILGAGKRKGYEDDGLINDNESDAETGAALKEKKRRKKRERAEEEVQRERPGQYKSGNSLNYDVIMTHNSNFSRSGRIGRLLN